MKPKPFWVSNHLHVPFRRPFAPVQKDARIGANTADLPDHMARDLAIAMSLVDAKGEILYDSARAPGQNDKPPNGWAHRSPSSARAFVLRIA